MLGILILSAVLGALVTFLIGPSNLWLALGWWTLTSAVAFVVVAIAATFNRDEQAHQMVRDRMLRDELQRQAKK